MSEKRWRGTWPAKCDLCKTYLHNVPYFVDGRTRNGQWALLCTQCHKDIGVGFGLGKGQKYRSTDRIKVEG